MPRDSNGFEYPEDYFKESFPSEREPLPADIVHLMRQEGFLRKERPRYFASPLGPSRLSEALEKPVGLDMYFGSPVAIAKTSERAPKLDVNLKFDVNSQKSGVSPARLGRESPAKLERSYSPANVDFSHRSVSENTAMSHRRISVNAVTSYRRVSANSESSYRMVSAHTEGTYRRASGIPELDYRRASSNFVVPSRRVSANSETSFGAGPDLSLDAGPNLDDVYEEDSNPELPGLPIQIDRTVGFSVEGSRADISLNHGILTPIADRSMEMAQSPLEEQIALESRLSDVPPPGPSLSPVSAQSFFTYQSLSPPPEQSLARSSALSPSPAQSLLDPALSPQRATSEQTDSRGGSFSPGGVLSPGRLISPLAQEQSPLERTSPIRSSGIDAAQQFSAGSPASELENQSSSEKSPLHENPFRERPIDIQSSSRETPASDDDALSSDDDFNATITPENIPRKIRDLNLSTYTVYRPPSPPPPPPEGLRRSSRRRIRPLQRWKNERVLYGYPSRTEINPNLDVFKFPPNNIKAIIRNTEKPRPKRTYKRRERSFTRFAKGVRNITELCDKPDAERIGELWYAGKMLELDVFNSENSLVQAKVAVAPLAVTFKEFFDTADSDEERYKLGAIFKNVRRGMAVSYLDLPSNGSKSLCFTHDTLSYFNVIVGHVQVQLNEDMFVALAGTTFQVPEKNSYALRNVGDVPARLFVVRSEAGKNHSG